ncbi:hypothetical protein [Vagococcus silagei]|uniref:Uncharacterized protein n=1 Tax=Vagococcus silagei TaxID=2508885 RepID=A0A4S3B4G0_9ENTE|nr:hypothetical protein [Vagococcus silagei]THB61722.1 hypothetical protein ESZ54_03495 [Vagococcus silagei]
MKKILFLIIIGLSFISTGCTKKNQVNHKETIQTESTELKDLTRPVIDTILDELTADYFDFEQRDKKPLETKKDANKEIKKLNKVKIKLKAYQDSPAKNDLLDLQNTLIDYYEKILKGNQSSIGEIELDINSKIMHIVNTYTSET